MEFSNGEEFFTVINKENLNYVFFPGCQLGASEPDLVKVIYNDLNKKLNDEVGIILGCCGVIGKWSGNSKKFKEQIELIQNTLKDLNNPTLITACPTCYKIFTEDLNDVEIKMIYDYINDEDLELIVNYEEIAIDDPCTVRYDFKMQDRIRNIAKKLGFKVEELDYNRDKTTCCGYGGLTCFSNQELKENIVLSRINQSKLNYLTYCINCRDSYLSQNKQAKHILQLIYNFDGKNKKPNISERRYNRVQLKLDLTENKEGLNDYDIDLIMSEELKVKLEEKLILNKDIKDTILYGEENKQKIINKNNNHNLAYCKIKNVTFWVEYTIEDGKYLVYNAYSHRMNIEVD
jgi:glutamate synthase (NADPH/NADH) small chain